MIDTRTEKLSLLLKEEIERLGKERYDLSNKLNDAKREVELLQKEWSYLDTLVVYLQDTQDLIDGKASKGKRGEINDTKSDSL